MCGAVRYRIAGADAPIDICHCALCRRNGGQAQAAKTVRRDVFVFTDARCLLWYA
jgi:hypothetical protein